MIDRVDTIRIMLIFIDGKIWSIIDRGASFCHVSMIMAGIRGIP